MTLNKKYIEGVALVIAAFILGAVSHSVFSDYLRIRHENYLYQHVQDHTHILTDVELIRSWMTFSYINRIFNLPVDYLKDELGINDPDYPGISISKAAKVGNISTSRYTDKVKDIIKQFVISS